MGGQGKTQVALEYCRQAKNNAVRAIFWVDANSEISVKKSFESISESIKAPGQAIQDEERVRFVMEKLEKWPDSWIMVFDNHDDPAPFNLQDFIPEGEKGCILITSRHTDTGSLVDPENFIELQGLSEKESLELLFKQSRVKETGSDLQHGKHIVERLGYHPLAITQAGSYIQLRKIELHKFMDHYNMQRKDILQQTPQMTQYRRKLTDEAKETALNVFTTWELSFQQLQTKSTGIDSEDLMTLFAFFDCKDISDQLFCEARESYINSSGAGRSLETFLDVQDRWDQEKFVRVLIDFTQMSLAQAWSRDELGYCHLTLLPLVKDWIQLRTNMITFRNYSKFAADILTATLRNTYQHRKFQLSFPDRQRILSHFDTYSENIEFLKAGSQAEPFDSFYGEFHYFEFLATQFLDENGLYAEAEVTGRRVAEWLEHEFGIKDERTLAGLNNLVEALFRQDKYEEAEAIQRRVLQVSEENLGSEHPDHLTRLSNLASVLRRRGMLDEAEEIIRGVLQARENILGPEHNDTLSSLSSLGITITYQGRYEEAEKIHRIVIQRSEKVLGLDHPNICRSLWDLAWPLGKQKKYTEATEYYTRAYLGHEKVFGASHPDTIRCRRQHLKMLEEMERSDLNP
jgi:tetratricopeptide (TPR) repeat protein